MEQKELREFESRCIQDEPPFCTAACPLHVDARLFLKHMADDRVQDARKVLDKTMPFPAILGRICDRPCESACRLGEKGDAVALGDLEKFCVSNTAPPKKIMKLPPRDKRIAVLGSGISSLTAAWDLVKKGYGISVFEQEDSPGGTLLNIPEESLPGECIRDAIKTLEKLGVSFQFGASDTKKLLESLLNEFEAVYIGFDSSCSQETGVEFDGNRQGLTGREKLFAGGRAETPDSHVIHASQGRWAATSMDRYLQNVSMTAGREKEGPVESRLHTNMDGVSHALRVKANAGAGYTPDEAKKEASRCIQCECLECVKVCAYLEKYKSSPKSYVRQIYNNLSIVKGTRAANKMINSCNLCGLCETVCPTGFPMAEICHTTRKEMVAAGKMPPSAHEFALLDMDFSNSEDFFMARNSPGEDSSDWLFFPGCQLGGSSPDHVATAYKYLREKFDSKTGLMLGCCGAPAHWGGEDKLLSPALEKIRQAWEELGKPRVITACSSCQSVFGEFLPEIEICSLWEIIAGTGVPEESRNARKGKMPVAVIDPCTARDDKKVQDSVRLLLGELGAEIEEIPHSRDKTECCGFGGLMSNADPEVADEILRRRAEQSPLDYLSYCIVCRDHLASAGKNTRHLFDYIWPEHKTVSPGFSIRQENRMRLKSELLSHTWNEEPGTGKEYRDIKLRISEDVMERLESRRILKEDIQKVLHHAGDRGDMFKNPENGHILACHRPFKVTFWAEYEILQDEYVIHNAYCHRMTVAGGENL